MGAKAYMNTVVIRNNTYSCRKRNTSPSIGNSSENLSELPGSGVSCLRDSTVELSVTVNLVAVPNIHMW